MCSYCISSVIPLDSFANTTEELIRRERISFSQDNIAYSRICKFVFGKYSRGYF